ncbi:phage protein Gp36 family protein, partial [Acinetobacter bereziniae]
PLPSIPSTLQRIACNIARYRLYFQQPTDEVENRYKAEIDFLKRIADGKAVLNILNQDNEVTEEKPKNSPATMPIGTTYRGGVFGDDILNRMPSIKEG